MCRLLREEDIDAALEFLYGDYKGSLQDCAKEYGIPVCRIGAAVDWLVSLEVTEGLASERARNGE